MTIAIAAGTATAVVVGSMVGIRLASSHHVAASPPPTTAATSAPPVSPSPSPTGTTGPPSTTPPTTTPPTTPPGSPISGPTSFPFQAGAGEGLAARLTRVTYKTGVNLRVTDSGGALVGGSTIIAPGGFVDTIRLPAAGAYEVEVAPNVKSERGSFRLHLIHVPPDVTGEITLDGPPATIANAVPGQNMRLTFPATKGRRISVNETNLTVQTAATVAVLDPGGNPVSSLVVLPPSGFSDTTDLPVDGTYTLLIDPDEADVGSITIDIHLVPPDPTVETRPNAEPFTLTTTVAGQNASFTFAGKNGQRVSMILSDITVPTSVGTGLDAPDGTRVGGQLSLPPKDFLDVQTLPQDGTYTMQLDMGEDGTGSVTVALFDVPPDPVAALGVDGSAQTVRTTAPGQNVVLQVRGASGPVTLHCTNLAFDRGLVVRQLDANGRPVGPLNIATPTFGDIALTPGPDGQLTVLLDPIEDDVGSVTVSVSTGPSPSGASPSSPAA